MDKGNEHILADSHQFKIPCPNAHAVLYVRYDITNCTSKDQHSREECRVLKSTLVHDPFCHRRKKGVDTFQECY